MDSVIRHWLAMLDPKEDGMEGLGLSIQDLAVYFYTNDVRVASTQPRRLQRGFGVLASLFDQVGFRTNTRKSVIMAFQTCHAPNRMSLEAYKRRMTGTGPTFRE